MHLVFNHLAGGFHRLDIQRIWLMAIAFELGFQRNKERLLHIAGNINFADAILYRLRDLAVFVARTPV